MDYNDAKRHLEIRIKLVPNGIRCFISPRNPDSIFAAIRSMSESKDNEQLLRDFNVINNDDLDVFVTFQEGPRIYYPQIDYFLATLEQSSPS